MNPNNQQNQSGYDINQQQNFQQQNQQIPQQQGSSGNFYNPQEQNQQQGMNYQQQNFYNPQQNQQMPLQGSGGSTGGSGNFYNPQQNNPQSSGGSFGSNQFYTPNTTQQTGSGSGQNFYNPTTTESIQNISNQQTGGSGSFNQPKETSSFFNPTQNTPTKGPPPMMNNSSYFDPNEIKATPPPSNLNWNLQDSRKNISEMNQKMEEMEISDSIEIDLKSAENLPRPTFDKYNSFVPQPDVSPLFNRFNVKGEEPVDYSKAQSSSCFCRATVQTVPSTPQLLTQWNLPFGVIVKPFSNEEEIPCYNFKSTGPIRCFNCKAYVNPFVLFIEDGRKWQCNMCKSINQVHHEYYAPLDNGGKRVDIRNHPELLHGSMDFFATKEYLSRTPQPPAYLFVIDLTKNSATAGMIECMAESILQVIDTFEERTMIGFITFDSKVHFYNLNPKLNQPQMIVSGELEENLLPLPSSSLLVDLKDSKKQVVNLLKLLQSGMFSDTEEKDNCLGTALKAAARILGPVGGKLCLFLSSLPNVGPFKLTNRETQTKGLDSDTKLAQQLTGEYKELALRFAQDQISVDMFLTTSTYLDVATISSLSKYTGGKLKYYPGFQHDITGDQFIHDLKRLLTSKTNFEAVMRVRVSSGLTVKNYFGNTFLGKKGLMLLPNIDSDSVFGIEIGHESSFISTVNACVQVAVLYTNNIGERRIRVHTITLPTTQKLTDLYKHADVNATIGLMSKIAADQSLRFGLVQTRNKLRDWNVNVFKNYRNLQKQSSKLLLPPSLSLLPLYTQSLAKSYALSSDPFIKIDLRMSTTQLLLNESIEKILYTIQPEMIEIQGDHENLNIIPLSSSCLNSKSIYLMNLGSNLYIWIGKDTSEDLQKEIFSAWNHIVDPEKCPIDEGYLFGKYFIDVVEMYRKEEFLSLRLIRQEGPLEKLFQMKLTEDKTASGMGYLDFMNHIHRQMDLSTL
eukprot:gene7422-11745_t